MIVLDLQTFRQSRENGNVTGVIFLKLPGGEFPEQGWSDFPVIVLGWWTQAFLELEVLTRREVQWRFMDGPYTATLAGIQRGDSTGGFGYQEVRGALLDTAERVIAQCEQHKMYGTDLETLRGNVRQLKANKTVQRTGASRFAQIEIQTSVAAGSRR